jgi:hypothetical protein
MAESRAWCRNGPSRVWANTSWPGNARDVIRAAIDDFYLTRQQPSVSALMIEIRRRCRLLALLAPSRRAVQRRAMHGLPSRWCVSIEGEGRRATDLDRPLARSLCLRAIAHPHEPQAPEHPLVPRICQ